MKCPTCSVDTAHIRIDKRGIGCHNCLNFSESGGSPTDKILTRNASRITDEHIQYEGDLITPYIVDKNTNKPIVNEEFINLYPDKAAETYTKSELASVGQPDLKPAEAEDTSDIAFSGDDSEAIAEIMKQI